MPRVWAWFHEPSAVLSLVDELGDESRVSVVFRDPHHRQDVVITGPLTRDMACYPFLDIRHQIRRLGMKKTAAEHYVNVLQRGGAVVCIEAPDNRTIHTLTDLDAQGLMV